MKKQVNGIYICYPLNGAIMALMARFEKLRHVCTVLYPYSGFGFNYKTDLIKTTAIDYFLAENSSKNVA